MRRAPLLLLFAFVTCVPKTKEPAAPAEDMAVARVSPRAVEVSNTNAVMEGAPASEGWVTSRIGVERAPREEVLDALRRSPGRVLVRASLTVEECSGAGGTHRIFVVDDAWGVDRPFAAAHLGGHAVRLEREPAPGQLYVAGVSTHAPVSFGRGSGICLDELPPFDASVQALLPVRDAAEGMHVIETLR